MNNELEEMRQQMNILKEKLQKQNIVNDRVLRRSMRRNVLGISRRYTFVCVLCILLIPYCYWAFVQLNGMSIYLWIVTCVLALTAFCYTLYTGRHLTGRLSEKNLLEVREKVAAAKKLDKDWLKIGIPLVILWLGYFGYEQYRVLGGENLAIPVAICCFSAIIGGAIGLKIHFKIQEEYEDIINEIDDFNSENE